METQRKNRFGSHKITSRRHHHHHLPEEIIEQIMIKLPTKSILRFKSVSKSWRLLTSSDHFIKAHLEKSSKDKSLKRHHITFGSSRRVTKKKKKCSLPSFLYGPAARDDNNNNTVAVVDFDSSYPMCDSAITVGSCNGLVCVYLKNEAGFILWNPTTRKFKHLPPVHDDADRDYLTAGGSRFFAGAYGFGFDESNDDYKVIVMWRHDAEQKLLAKVYSSKTDSWRKLDDPMLDWNWGFLKTGRFARGKLHWKVCGRGGNAGWSIISFDLESEVFGTVEWPPGGDCVWLLTHAIDGCLCCFSPDTISSSRPDHIDYWILKEEEEEEGCPRWRRFATLGRPRLEEYFYPFFAGPDSGDILARRNGSFVIFMKESDGGYSSRPRVIHHKGWSDASSIYVESLVEP